MLIHDLLPGAGARLVFSESYLRAAFETDAAGSLVSRIPEVLREAGVEGYDYRTDLSFDDLRLALRRGAAIVRVVGRQPDAAHVVIVEEADGQFVALRDPLPLATGSAYRVAVADFLAAWLSGESDSGRAVIMLESPPRIER
jgi:hypothetical protein